MRNAFHGDMNAALALHEALLPGWVARMTVGTKTPGMEDRNNHCWLEEWESGNEVRAMNMPSPARAWLLAVLRAVETEGRA